MPGRGVPVPLPVFADNFWAESDRPRSGSGHRAKRTGDCGRSTVVMVRHVGFQEYASHEGVQDVR
ncbi:hypothetical protein KPATCC21470_1322 [Kitasatospora purpeofusca]